jgi:hypothetical protein
MYYDYSRAPCEKCGGETHQESADIGVGIICGPRGCVECGWSESEEYDQTIEANRQPDEKGGYKDQFGWYHPVGSSVALAHKLADQ